MKTQAIVTEAAIMKADAFERCRLMREIVRGATYTPSQSGWNMKGEQTCRK